MDVLRRLGSTQAPGVVTPNPLPCCRERGGQRSRTITSPRRDRTDRAAFCLRCSPQAPQRKNTLINESDRGEVVNKLEDNAFDDLPLLLAVPRAATLLGISRAAAYRLVASGELPVRRLGGRVYIVTAGLRELVAS
jgi:excisionase family DNA binding protein